MPSGQTDIVNRTRYDNEGRVIETRQPASDGSDAGTRQTIYYTSGTNNADAACGSKPRWAGLVCVTQYAGGALPVERVTDYNADLQPLEVTETVSGTLRRTTTTTYDTAGRVAKTWAKTHGMSGSVATTGTLTEYDPVTGAVTAVKAIDNTGAVISGRSVASDYDAWGRETTYTVDNGSGGETTTTSYNSAGDVDVVTDPRGTTTYTYDGTDADGNEERRGLTTRVGTSRPGAGDVEFTGAYNADGNLVTHEMPGGLTQRTSVNTAGELLSMSYSGRVNLPNPNDPEGAPVPTDDIAWIGWSQTSDIFGRTRAEWTPEGAAFTGNLSAGAATGYARSYTYDRAGRLTEVVDHTASSGGGTATVEDGVLTTPAGTTCQTRTYGFDVNGNRTSLVRRGADTDGTCATTVTSTKTWSWDNADRPTNAGYDIDSLGRITALPAGDTPSGAGNMALAYHDDDTVKSITQGTTMSAYALDPVGRRATETTVDGASISTVDLHYVGATDSPGWSSLTDDGTVTTTRYVDNLAGDLAATLISNGSSTTADAALELALANPHGDIVTTVPVPTTGPATGVEAWETYDEYGNGTMQVLSGSRHAYGWVGNKQRATQPHGLVLMGARPYNPTTGQFTSRDPIYGGNTTTYTYPQDPVNAYDLDGLKLGESGFGGRGMGGGYFPRLTVPTSFGKTLAGIVKRSLANIHKKGSRSSGIIGPRRPYGPYRSSHRSTKPARPGSRCSFASDTPVLMADGSRRPIAKIKVGDHVRAADPVTGASAARMVTAIWSHLDTLFLLPIGGNSIVTTEDHPFWSVTDQRFERADQLRPGELLSDAGGSTVPVHRGPVRMLAHEAMAFNMEVAELHTYYVGEASVLVHNEKGGCKQLPWKRGRKETNRFYPTREAAETAARRDAGSGGRCRYRPACSSGNHVHVDFLSKFGQIFHTQRYFWNKNE